MLLVIIVVVCLSIGYSAYNRELMISGEGIVRADVPIRITDVTLREVVNGTESFNPEFTKDTTNMSVSLNSNGSITYQVKVENKTGDRIIVKDIKELIHTNSSITYTINGLEENKVYDKEEITFTITFHNASNNVEDITLNLAYDMEVFDGYLITLVHDDEVKENVIFKENTTTSFTNLSLNDNDVVIKCNKGSIPNVLDNTLNVSNITSDSICEFYDSLNNAINSADTTENNLLLLKNDTSTNVNTINNKMNINFNGKTINNIFNIYEDIKIYSTVDGAFLQNTYSPIDIHEDAKVILDNLKIESDGHVIKNRDTSQLTIENTHIYSTNQVNSSVILTHGGNTILNVLNSHLEGPYAIGGQGGDIIVDNSELVATANTGININSNYCANIEVLNNTKITASNYGINFYADTNLCESSLIIDGTNTNYPTIIGQELSSLRIHSNTTVTINYGKLYGLNAPIINGTLITRDNLELVTEDYIYDGITYQYSYLKE